MADVVKRILLGNTKLVKHHYFILDDVMMLEILLFGAVLEFSSIGFSLLLAVLYENLPPESEGRNLQSSRLVSELQQTQLSGVNPKA